MQSLRTVLQSFTKSFETLKRNSGMRKTFRTTSTYKTVRSLFLFHKMCRPAIRHGSSSGDDIHRLTLSPMINLMRIINWSLSNPLHQWWVGQWISKRFYIHLPHSTLIAHIYRLTVWIFFYVPKDVRNKYTSSFYIFFTWNNIFVCFQNCYKQKNKSAQRKCLKGENCLKN